MTINDYLISINI